jgi:hypothetical protein
VRLDDDRTTCRQCRNRVTPRNRERQREVTRTKHDYWTDRQHHGAKIRLGLRLPLKVTVINSCSGGKPVGGSITVEPHLETGPRQFALQSRYGQRRFKVCPGNNVGAVVFEQLRQPMQ